MSLRAPESVAGIGMTSQRTRERMVARLREEGIRNPEVLAAMGAVPRHLFVDEALASRAYEDTALPIGFGQTISQPFVVARMIELLFEGAGGVARQPGKTLEIGTGCGYQAAVLARLSPEVYSIERLQALSERARRNVLGLRLSNLRLVHADGRLGLAQAAPFDSIIVAAAADAAPQDLLQQLAPGGRIVLPLRRSEAAEEQRIAVIDRTARGFEQMDLDPVRFVPLESGRK